MGFIARVASWIGLIVGIYAAYRLAPVVLEYYDPGVQEGRLLLILVILLVLGTVGAGIGALAAHSVRSLIPPGTGLRTVDRAAGGVVGGLGGLLMVWLLVPILADMPGVMSELARNSVVARNIHRYGPETSRAVEQLRRQVTEFNFPEVFAGIRPSPSTGAPPADLALPAAVRTRVAASTVRVTGTACGRVLSGSGFSPAAEIIVTNAHVVAGVDRPSVMRTDGRRLSATVVVFDPDRDLAVLRVDGLGQSPLPVADGDPGDDGAVFGHPRGSDQVVISPARIESTIPATGLDLYGSSRVRREVHVLAAELEPGDSGGALVNTSGAVVGVAFAIAPDQPSTAYALSSDELQAVLDVPRRNAVDTGPCLRP